MTDLNGVCVCQVYDSFDYSNFVSHSKICHDVMSIVSNKVIGLAQSP